MEIRVATNDDIEECVNIHKSSQVSRMNYSNREESLTRKYLNNYMNNKLSTVLVADNGKIAGYIVFTSDEWNRSFHIDFLFVRPDMQRTGVGTKLLHEAFRRVKEQKARIVFLETGKKDPAIDFYKKNGFSEAGHIESFYKGSQGDAVVLSRKFE